ncbi:type 2 lantibiotic biosynthesis protein LanM [Mycobacterium basiliense]|uniref:Type 2 lantibiotic biosynthesis protein LanM n=1 Tax=Mycobacterium basiliense TaxID=2094119 RepID=A0A447GLA6_9MYCO|nr:type 2 lanthipeptide synthetase LanM family protein [Mycobacterium basiliense]VDM91165.1 type 2 lantibiotic biosynthesis protein LanM [Mycobacterium basiliense]
MEEFYQRLIYRAATIDELLSDAFEPLPGQKADSELAARRLASWCQASASGDWSLFTHRLAADGLALEGVLAKFATARRDAARPAPPWFGDAVWIGEALHSSTTIASDIASDIASEPLASEPLASEVDSCAFEDLLEPVIRGAESRLWRHVGSRVAADVGEQARACLRRSLVAELSNLTAPAIYEQFTKARDDSRSTVRYPEFVADMRAYGFRRLFDDKPVLLRLMASLTRQWIDTSGELIARLGADLPAIRHGLLGADTCCEVTSIDGGLSDPHNFGRTVHIIGFADGSRVVYKPKDLEVDVAWHALIERLNRDAPIELRAARVLARTGYGWTEFVDHTSCPDPQGFQAYFQRAGAWLALFHCFAGSDMHQENIIAAGDHPMPIDLEMVLQFAEPPGADADSGAGRAYHTAMEKLRDSVLSVGLLPTYGKHSHSAFSIGGMISHSTPRIGLTWIDVNSDTMRPAKIAEIEAISNLPQARGQHARFGDHIDDFRSGFTEYATFLQRQRPNDLFEGFAGLTVRKVARPTRFYHMLVQRLKDHRTMEDGVTWSAQADFIARLADWQQDNDPLWPLQRLERAAVVQLNVPHFVMTSDGHEIRDATGASIPVKGMSGLDRARARLGDLDEMEVAWQAEIIRLSTSTGISPHGSATTPVRRVDVSNAASREIFMAEADRAARSLFEHAYLESSAAAWIGLDWLGDSEVSHLVPLGDDLYNGSCGIALFLAAHTAVTTADSSTSLAYAAMSRLRETLRGRNAPKMARLLGLGAGFGVGSIVYGLAVIAALLEDDDVLSDAQRAAQLITPDVISADRQLDVLGGSAGAILGLLRLYRQTGCGDALERAIKCGQHLLAQQRVGTVGRRSWPAPGSGSALGGMSHGAAGFAYALAALAAATGSAEFASASQECIAFENATFEAEHSSWRDTEGAGARGEWCHGLPGIGLARAAMIKHTAAGGRLVRADIRRALAGVEHRGLDPTDTLCCGTLGTIEFIWEAGDLLDRDDLRENAVRRLLTVAQAARSRGDYRWDNGTRRFNLGLFRGIAGVAYTMLRRVDPALPNALIWE